VIVLNTILNAELSQMTDNSASVFLTKSLQDWGLCTDSLMLFFVSGKSEFFSAEGKNMNMKTGKQNNLE